MWRELTWQELWRESEANKPGFKAGSFAMDEAGSIWRYIQANAAIAKGDLVMKHVVTGVVAALNGVCQAASTNHSGGGARIQLADGVATAANFKGNWFDPDPSDGATRYNGKGHDYWISITTSTGAGQVGYIYNRDQSASDYVDAWIITSSTSPGRLDTALSATSEYEVYTDSLCVKTTTATDRVVGVAQKAITSGCFAWTLVKGKGIIGWDTDATALAADDQLIIPTATAGKAGGGAATPDAVTTLAHVAFACSQDIEADGFIHADIDVLRQVSPANTLFMPSDKLYEWPRRY